MEDQVDNSRVLSLVIKKLHNIKKVSISLSKSVNILMKVSLVCRGFILRDKALLTLGKRKAIENFTRKPLKNKQKKNWDWESGTRFFGQMKQRITWIMSFYFPSLYCSLSIILVLGIPHHLSNRVEAMLQHGHEPMEMGHWCLM